jgi:hypothetical protein
MNKSISDVTSVILICVITAVLNTEILNKVKIFRILLILFKMIIFNNKEEDV